MISGRRRRFSPLSKILSTDENSNLLIYISGHGGNRFSKFRDFDEISTDEINETILELKRRNKFRKLLIFVDSCQALTLGDQLNTPDTFVVASSLLDQSAYSCNDDAELGVALMDRYNETPLKFTSASD